MLRMLREVVLGILVGSLTSILSVLLFSKLLGFDPLIILSILPKSITTAVGAPLAAEVGGDFTIAVVGIVVTGITGSIVAPYIVKFLHMTDKVAIGVGIGTSSHAVGTSKALEMGEVEGAMSGLSLAIAAVITVFLLPCIVSVFM